MKQIFMVICAVTLLAAGCIKTSTPESNMDLAPLEPTQVFTGDGFTFDYPADWTISDTGSPSEEPGSCGNAFGDAESCTFLATPDMTGIDYAVFINVFQSSKPLSKWCEEGNYAYVDCTSAMVNGIETIATTNPLTDYPLIESRMFAKDGKIVTINGGAEFKYEIDNMADSFTFTQ